MSMKFTTSVVESGTKALPYDLQFENYVWKGKEGSLSQNAVSAIYCFYSCWKDRLGKDNIRLLYIGKSLDLKTRLMQHAKRPNGFAKQGSVMVKDLDDYLCDPEDVERPCFYAYALLDGRSLKKCEAAMIKQFKPRINIENTKTLGCHDESYFNISGKYVYDCIEKKTYHVLKDEERIN